MLPNADQAEVVRVFQQMLAEASESLAAEFEAMFRGLGSWDLEDSRRFIQQTAPLWRAHKQVVIDLTSEMLSLITEVDTIALAAKEVLATPPNPDVAFRTMWKSLKNGTPFDDAFETAAGMVRGQATTSLTRASREATSSWVEASPFRSPWDDATANQPRWRPSTRYRQAYDRSAVGEQRVVGYRRVLTGTTCRWCARVATQRYLTADSADFGHHNCDCAVLPIIGDRDPGQIVNGALYDRLEESGTDVAVDRARNLTRLDKQAANADRRRREALAAYELEDDIDRKIRLEDRAFEWDEKATKYRAQAAEMRTEHIAEPVPRYVTETGAPAPDPQPVG